MSSLGGGRFQDRPSLIVQLLDYAILRNGKDYRTQETLANLIVEIDSMNKQELDILVDATFANRIPLILANIIRESFPKTRNVAYLQSSLSNLFRKLQSLQSNRNEIAKMIVNVLTSHSIDFLFFKTFNEYGGIGVDVDLLIPRTKYPECVSALMKSGFYPIDSLSKTYATGFRTGNNPIIVDLHTDLAVLGVQYLSPERLLSHSDTVNIREDDQNESSSTFPIRVLEPKMSGIVSIAHSIIKENSIRASDILEVHKAIKLDKESFRSSIESEDLQSSSNVFGSIALMLLPRVSEFREMFLSNEHTVVSYFCTSQVRRKFQALPENLPVAISPVLSLPAFLDRLLRREQFTKSIPIALGSLKFRRNLVIAGQKIFKKVLS